MAIAAPRTDTEKAIAELAKLTPSRSARQSLTEISTLAAIARDRAEQAADDDGLKIEPLDVPTNWGDFARTCRVRTGSGIAYFDPYSYQEAIVGALTAHRGSVILKSRQMGISETAWLWFLWRACLTPGYCAALFSKRKEDTSDLARRVRLAIGGLGFETPTDNLLTIELPNGSRLLFRTAKKSDGRGIASVHDLLFDEAAFVDEIDEIYGGALPAQSMVGEAARTIVVSTPDRATGWYYDMLADGNGKRDVLKICQQIRERRIEPCQVWTDDNGWAKILLHWRAHPIYGQQDDYLQRIARDSRMPLSTVRREYDLDFGESDRTVFGVDLIEKALSFPESEEFPEFEEW